MTQKKLVKLNLILIILLLLPLPLLNTILILSDNNKINFKKFNKKFLYSTDNLEGTLNYYLYEAMQRSFNEGQAVIGKDGFLFLGNDYARVLDKVQDKFPYSKSDIDTWTDKLRAVQSWYEDRDIKFIIVIAPNKHTVYNDKLPNWINASDNTITDDIVNLAKNKNINILDLRATLIKQNSPQLYFSTDTHWNNKGASIGYQETIQYINKTYQINYKTPKYSLSITTRGGGDLAGFLKIGSLLSRNYETNYKFNLVNESDVCHGTINKEHNLLKCNIKKNPVMGINGTDQYMINNKAVNKGKLLLLCDSFGSATSKPYNETFNTIWKFHYGHINGQELVSFVQENKPDIVIYQVVERDLYNQGIVKKLPISF